MGHRYSATLKNLHTLTRPTMQILLTGVACVGKSSIGKKLAEDIGYVFFDLDVEIEKYYKKSIGVCT